MIKANFDTEKISVKIGIFFSRFGLSPNAWTILALIPAFFGFLSLCSGDIGSALVLFLLSGGIDAIDGAVARVTGSVTPLGAFLDGIIDRYVEILLYFGLLFYMENLVWINFFGIPVPNYFWIAVLIFGALMPTYVRAYADHKGIVTSSRDHKRMGGLIERPERLMIIYIGMFISIFDPNYITYFVALLAILANITAVQRIWFVVNYRKK